ncbi:MAG: DNA glycosylase [Candidatus Micrarchaeota archaeon]|nr:DNA glycosylase [Candidatus Micrarchaeota archaeon]
MQFSTLQIVKNNCDVVEFPLSFQEFNLDYTLESAQCFTWNKIDLKNTKAWQGIIQGTSVTAIQHPDHLAVYSDLPREKIAQYFSLDTAGFSLGNVLKSLVIESENDEVLLTALKQFPGLRILRQDVWETIASFICSQNSSVEMIQQRVNLLSQRFGTKLKGNASGGFAFPPSIAIATASEEDLQACKLGYRVPYLKNSAMLIANSEFSLEELKKMRFEEARQYLMSLPGVGPKVADCICLFSLGHLNAFPVDTHVFKLLADFYAEDLKNLQGNRKNMRYDDLTAFASHKFGDYCGYGQQYLFHLHRVARTKLENFYA